MIFLKKVIQIGFEKRTEVLNAKLQKIKILFHLSCLKSTSIKSEGRLKKHKRMLLWHIVPLTRFKRFIKNFY